MVVNIGAVAFGHKQFVHDVTPEDGPLDLLVLTRTDVLALTEVASSPVFGNRSPMLHWTIERAEISTKSPQQTAIDGELLAASHLAVEVLPAAIKLIVPNGSNAETQRGRPMNDVVAGLHPLHLPRLDVRWLKRLRINPPPDPRRPQHTRSDRFRHHCGHSRRHHRWSPLGRNTPDATAASTNRGQTPVGTTTPLDEHR